jgi:hypothetical protein
MPTPVSRTAITVPGSGIDVAALGALYILKSGGGAFGTGSGIGSGTGFGAGSGTGSGIGLGTGSGTALGTESGDTGLGVLSLAQAGEKFPGPHTSTAAEGGAAAR